MTQRLDYEPQPIKISYAGLLRNYALLLQDPETDDKTKDGITKHLHEIGAKIDKINLGQHDETED